MAQWTKDSRERDDDPYHAWAYDRDGPRPGLCPVIVKLRDSDGDRAALIENLNAFEGLFADRDGTPSQLVISTHDRAHIERSIAYLESFDTADAAREIDTSYARIFLIYAPEELLLASGDLGGGDLFEVLFAGRPSRREAIREINRQGQSGFVPPQASLAIIDDSFAFLNAAFLDGAQSPLFSEIWFQGLERPGVPGSVDGARVDREAIAAILPRLEMESEDEVYRSEIAVAVDDDANGMPDLRFRPIDASLDTHQPLQFGLSHGTHVASTELDAYRAATEPGTGIELYGVALPSEVTQDTSGSSLSTYLIAALRQVMLWQDGLYPVTYSAFSDEAATVLQTPLVINFSYGIHAGPKDGASKLNSVIAEMLDSRNTARRPTALVVPMGNGYDSRSSARRDLAQGEEVTLDWVVLPDDRTSSFVEIFSKGTDPKAAATFEVTLVPPVETFRTHNKKGDLVDEPLPELSFTVDGSETAKSWRLHDAEDRLMAGLSEWPLESGSGWRHHAFLALGPTFLLDDPGAVVPHGRWTLRIKNTSGAPITVQAYVQRDDVPGTYPAYGRQSYLDHDDAWEFGDGQDGRDLTGNFDQLAATSPITHARTASVFSSIVSNHVFVVGAGQGAYDHSGVIDPSEPALYAAAGPRSLSRGGPDYTALADRSRGVPGIYGPGTLSGTEVAMNGSSVAAPQVAGFLAANPDLVREGVEAVVAGATTSMTSRLGIQRPHVKGTGH